MQHLIPLDSQPRTGIWCPSCKAHSALRAEWALIPDQVRIVVTRCPECGDVYQRVHRWPVDADRVAQ